MVKKVLILTAGFGEGHNSAARGLRDSLVQISNGDVQVEVRDIFADCYGFLNDWARKLYLALVEAAPRSWGAIYNWLDHRQQFAGGLRIFYPAQVTLERFLNRFAPDVVVSVYPAYPHMMQDILGSADAPFQRVVVVTDSITINAMWHRCAADYFVVPNDRTAQVLHEAGVPAEKIKALGFPVSPQFAAGPDERPPPSLETGYRVLYLASRPVANASELVGKLAELPGLDLTVNVGNLRRLRRSLEAIRAEGKRPFEIIGWSDELPRLLRSSHLLITKAGGATVQEAIAARCPVIINQFVPGQEEGNVQLILQTGSGALATSPGEVVAAVGAAFRADAAQWRHWSANITQLSRPAAALEIAQFLLALPTGVARSAA